MFKSIIRKIKIAMLENELQNAVLCAKYASEADRERLEANMHNCFKNVIPQLRALKGDH